MKRLRDRFEGSGGGGGPVTEAEVLDYAAAQQSQPYKAGPVSPLVQIGTRVALWGAVAIGFLGGVVGLSGIGRSGGSTVVEAGTETEVPAPVAGVAEQAVQEWLLTMDGEENDLGRYFLEPVDVDTPAFDDVTLLDLTTVRGERIESGYWAVTVAAEVLPARIVQIDGDGGDDDGDTDGDAEQSAVPEVEVWYLEVGIVGDTSGSLMALRTPAVMPPPTGISSEEWRTAGARPRPPDQGDPVAELVEAFLASLLTGDGDPERFVVPGLSVESIDPPLFAELTLEALSLEVQDDDGEEVRVQAHVGLTTAGGVRRHAAYELSAVRRVDRWEIADLWGAPTLGTRPEAAPVDEED